MNTTINFALKDMLAHLHTFNHQVSETGVTPGTWWLIDGKWLCGECGYAAPATNQVLIFGDPTTVTFPAHISYVSVVHQTQQPENHSLHSITDC